MTKNKPSLPASREKPILLGLATQKKAPNGKTRISINWGRLFLSFSIICLIGWLSAAGALFLYFKYNKEFDDVTYSGMLLLPFRLNEHRTEMGDYHINRGLSEMKEGNYRDALRLLRLGVARSPKNIEGRVTLAEFYEYAIQRPDIATSLMITGIEEIGLDDVEYLKKTIRMLLRHQMDEEVLELARNHLEDGVADSQTHMVLAFGAANASYLRGNYDLAEDYLFDYKLTDTQEGISLSSNISWDRGNRITAISKLEQALKKFPNSEPLLMQLSRHHREMGNIDEARRYAILRNVVDPLSAAPRLELLYIYNKSGDFEREERETQRLLKQFRKDETALQALANFAADSGKVELARRTYEEALENEFSIDAFALLLVEAHLVSEDYEGALSFAEELLKERPEWLTKRWSTFNSLRAVASYSLNRPDLGEIYLQDFLEDASNQPQTYLAVARRFSTVDRTPQARTVLLSAHRRNPSNQKILSELIRVELALGNTENLNELLNRLLQMRRPEMNLLVSAYRKLGSDRFIFTPDRDELLIQLNSMLRENSQSLSKIDS